jgi:hypothetical protein
VGTVGEGSWVKWGWIVTIVKDGALFYVFVFWCSIFTFFNDQNKLIIDAFNNSH